MVQLRGRLKAAERRAHGAGAELERTSRAIAASPIQHLISEDGAATVASVGLSALVGGSCGPEPEAIAEFVHTKDTPELRRCIAALRVEGTAFDLMVQARAAGRSFAISGRRSGRAAVLFVCDRTREAAEAVRAAGLAGLLDLLPIPVWRRRPDLSLDFVNRAYVEAVEGVSADDPERLPELGQGVVGDHGRAIARTALSQGGQHSEAHHVVIGGARRPMQIAEAPKEDGVAGYALDRTEVEAMQADLSRHIRSHEEVLHNLGTGVAIYGADQRLQFFNSAFHRMTRLEEAWLRAQPTIGEVLDALRDQRLISEAVDFPAFKRQQIKLFTSHFDPIVEQVDLPDGTARRTVVTPHPFGGLLVTWEAVTDRMALERSFTTLLQVQRETLDNLYEGVAVVGGDGRIKLSNPVFERMWQLPSAELAAEPHIADLVDRIKDMVEYGVDWPGEREEIVAHLTDRSSHSGRLERADGSVLDYATVPLPDGAVLLSFLDVSDSIRAERALRERNEALETADRLKSEFIANVSYELRTPLNTVIGFTEILAGQYFGSLNERQLEYAKAILESSQHLLALINDILDLASIEAGHMTLELDTIDLHATLSAVLQLTRERARKKKLAIEFDCPRDIGPVVADKRRLKQALFNILSNAVKFTLEEGSIVVSSRRRAEQIIVTVTDTGIGIPAQDRERVFDKFERGSNLVARRSGAGLGLSPVKSFIELHGGRVEIESDSGTGTKVTCHLPARSVA